MYYMDVDVASKHSSDFNVLDNYFQFDDMLLVGSGPLICIEFAFAPLNICDSPPLRKVLHQSLKLGLNLICAV